MLVDKGCRVPFDLVVKVGRLRYDDHRQLKEIQSYLKCSSTRMELPLSSIGMIAKRFLDFCRMFHQSHEGEIHEDIHARGGYFLHFDGSTEHHCGQNALVLMDSRSGHILESRMVDSENSGVIKDALETVREKYGNPLAVVSDLHPGFVNACLGVFGEDVIHILCHYHFLRTFREMFHKDHMFLKTCMTQKWKLTAGLKKQLKSLQTLRPQAGYPKELKTLKRIEQYEEKTGDAPGTYKYVLRWILNFKQDSSAKGVPFDLPYLDLYSRLVSGKKVIDRIFAQASAQMRLRYYRHGFSLVIEKTRKLGHNEPGFRQALDHLQYAHKWFNKLRAVLFLDSQVKDDRAPLSRRYRLSTEEAQQIPHRLNDFLKSVKKERKRPQISARKSFLRNLAEQVEKYQDNLHVPILYVTIAGEKTSLVPPRTNNDLERLFRFIKSQLRRCSGRGKLPKEFGSVGALLPYYLTMKNLPTFKNIFTDDRKLEEEFVKLFAKPWMPPDNLIPLSKRPECFPHGPQLAAAGG